MTSDLSRILRLFGETLQNPADVANRIKSIRAPHEAGWMVLAFGTIAVVILLHLERLIPGSAAQTSGLGGTPFIDVVILGALSAMLVFDAHRAGFFCRKLSSVTPPCCHGTQNTAPFCKRWNR